MAHIQDPVQIGLIGCGTISAEYLEVLRQYDDLRVVRCADLDQERAQQRAAQFGIPRAVSVDALLADPEIELVVNLTVPAAHASVSMAALDAGKSVYQEKPLATDLSSAAQTLQSATRRGLLLGCAPDTFLGPTLQSCRHTLDAGEIGRPIGASAFCLARGPEWWHPDPAFFYQPGGGPMLDIGPYYLTALVFLFGPIRRVAGSARTTFARRTITAPARAGETIDVNTPTHVAGLLDFANGTVVTLAVSFDVWHSTLPPMEIYGTDGTLLVPDPNMFDEIPRMRGATDEHWHDLHRSQFWPVHGRGIGVVEMARALRHGSQPRASGDLAYHVLECMTAFITAVGEARTIDIRSTCLRPDPLQLDPSR